MASNLQIFFQNVCCLMCISFQLYISDIILYISFTFSFVFKSSIHVAMRRSNSLLFSVDPLSQHHQLPTTTNYAVMSIALCEPT